MLVSTDAGKRRLRPSGSSIPGPRPARDPDAPDLLGVLAPCRRAWRAGHAGGRGVGLAEPSASDETSVAARAALMTLVAACCPPWYWLTLEPNLIRPAEDSPGIGGDRRALQSAAERSTGRPAPRPLAPRARVEPHRPESGQLGGEHDRAGGDARAAVRDDVRPGAAPALSSAGRSSRGVEEAAAGRELGGGHVHGSRDVAGHRVDRLGLAAVALRRARVEQHAAPRRRPRRHPRCRPSRGRAPRSRRARRSPRRPAQRPARLAPGAPGRRRAPPRLVAEVAQQPPEPRRAALARLVVGHDARAGADAGAAGGAPRRPPARAAGGGRARRAPPRGRASTSRKAAPGTWPASQARAPGARLAQHEAAVHDPQAGLAQVLAQPARVHERSHRRSLGRVRAMVLPHAPGSRSSRATCPRRSRARGRCCSRSAPAASAAPTCTSWTAS